MVVLGQRVAVKVLFSEGQGPVAQNSLNLRNFLHLKRLFKDKIFLMQGKLKYAATVDLKSCLRKDIP